MEDKQSKSDKKWQVLAWEIGGTATAWIVVPALIGIFGGQALDGYFRTTPVLFAVCTLLAFLITVFGLLRIAKAYLRSEQANKKDQDIK